MIWQTFLSARYLDKHIRILGMPLSDLLLPGGKKMIEIKPYGFKENGRTFYAECYPYINNKPVPAIADCRYCTFNNPDENEICYGWQDNLDEAPLFCGPVCPKFDLVSNILYILEAELRRCLWREKTLLHCQNH